MRTTPPENPVPDSFRPWLFYREGLDWRWKSFRRVGREARESTLPSAPPAPPHEADPDAVARLVAVGFSVDASREAEAIEALLAERLGASQPVVFASPSIVRAMAPTLAALTLRLEAAWPLEPADDAFVATAVWLRPHVILGLGAELRDLAAAWDDGVRKWSRLAAVLRVVPAAAGETASVEELESAFGVPVLDVPGP